MLYEEMTKWRKLRGMSLDELSLKSHVPIGTLKKVMCGSTPNPQIETVQAIANALDCTLDDFVLTNTQCPYTYEELHLIYQYRSLDAHGQKALLALAEIEFERCKSNGTEIL